MNGSRISLADWWRRSGTFGPNTPITREQLAVMLWRYSGSPAAASRELRFSDGREISRWSFPP